jgi:hypothetical protein
MSLAGVFGFFAFGWSAQARSAGDNAKEFAADLRGAFFGFASSNAVAADEEAADEEAALDFAFGCAANNVGSSTITAFLPTFEPLFKPVVEDIASNGKAAKSKERKAPKDVGSVGRHELEPKDGYGQN